MKKTYIINYYFNHIKSTLIPIFTFIIIGCSSSSDTEISSSDENIDAEPIIITDRTGQEWDITNAWETYGMDPEYFNFGIGIDAISSVDMPRVIDEGDPEYPDSSNQMEVFGVDHNGEQRAYAVADLSRHEVFNEIYPGDKLTHVAVTY